jgi:hypothetical protein
MCANKLLLLLLLLYIYRRSGTIYMIKINFSAFIETIKTIKILFAMQVRNRISLRQIVHCNNIFIYLLQRKN